jgi:hypothetical protein
MTLVLVKTMPQWARRFAAQRIARTVVHGLGREPAGDWCYAIGGRSPSCCSLLKLHCNCCCFLWGCLSGPSGMAVLRHSFLTGPDFGTLVRTTIVAAQSRALASREERAEVGGGSRPTNTPTTVVCAAFPHHPSLPKCLEGALEPHEGSRHAVKDTPVRVYRTTKKPSGKRATLPRMLAR